MDQSCTNRTKNALPPIHIFPSLFHTFQSFRNTVDVESLFKPYDHPKYRIILLLRLLQFTIALVGIRGSYEGDNDRSWGTQEHNTRGFPREMKVRIFAIREQKSPVAVKGDSANEDFRRINWFCRASLFLNKLKIKHVLDERERFHHFLIEMQIQLCKLEIKARQY